MTSSAAARKSRNPMRAVFLGASVLSLVALASSAPSAPAGAEQVDLKLVLATDVSGSINDEEAQIQRLGTEQSLECARHGRVDAAIIDAKSSAPLTVRIRKRR